ncbi:MAG: M14 family metallopeptidase, partial [Acidobacteria bacterium]|nr:M14 family metallopeptidase [Acidobacteriota bacterium]
MLRHNLVRLLLACFTLQLFASGPATLPRAQSPAALAASKVSVPAPEDVLGFRPGDDRMLASWAQVVDYFRRLDAASDRVKFEEIGKTTMGAPFVYATISTPENLARLDEYRSIQRQLADPRTLGANADRKAEALIRRGKTIVLITCGIHSTEVGSYLSSMLIAHRLATSNDAEVQEILRNTIVLLVPSLNPDGVDIVKNWYDKTLGTPYEGTSPPELYHKYTGHDNNRDWYAFTQVETQLTVDKIHNVWHPQIVHDIHQQGAYGSRLFLPPYMKPVEPNVPRQLVEGYTELGHFMGQNMLAKGFRGITWDSTYDAWTPARAYSHYHGGVRILSETASANIATPITVKPDQLRAGEGYDARKESPNFPVPWSGGEWHMRDITNYMTTGAFELLRHAATNRAAWLRRFYDIGREAVRPRRPGELYAYTLPPSDNFAQTERRDALLSILRRGGVEVDDADPQNGRPIDYLNRTTVILMNQPYAAFAKALLEAQHYPDLRDREGRPIPPYDVTAHTLTLLMGVEAAPHYKPFRYRKVKFLGSYGGGG